MAKETAVFQRIDDFLIDRVFQPIADRLAGWTDPDSLGRTLIIGDVVFALCRDMKKYLDSDLGVSQAALTGFGVAGAMFMLRVMPSSSAGAGAMPVARLSLRSFRFICTMILMPLMPICAMIPPYNLMYFFNDLSLLCGFFGFYFMSCRSNPPKRKEQHHRDLAFAGTGSR